MKSEAELFVVGTGENKGSVHGPTYLPVATIDQKMITSSMAWISHAHTQPRVSRMLVASSHPRKLAMIIPLMPAGCPPQCAKPNKTAVSQIA